MQFLETTFYIPIALSYDFTHATYFNCILNNDSTSARWIGVIDSQRGAKRRVGYSHLISNKREWNNCFIKNHQQILLNFADFAWLEQPEGNLIDAISRVFTVGYHLDVVVRLA